MKRTNTVIIILTMAGCLAVVSAVGSNDAADTPVLKKIDELRAYIEEAQKTGSLKYAATATDREIEPYAAAIGLIDQTRQDVYDLSTEKVSQEEAVSTMRSLVSQRLILVRQLIDAIKEKKAGSVAQIDVTDKGKAVLSQISDIIAQIREEELRAKSIRDKELEELVKKSDIEKAARDKELEELARKVDRHRAAPQGNGTPVMIIAAISLGLVATTGAVYLFRKKMRLFKSVVFQDAHKRKPGEVLPVEVRAGRISTGEKSCITATICEAPAAQDIKKISSGDRDLIESISNNLFGIFYIFNDKGQVIKWNKNLEKVSGYKPEEIIKMSPASFFAQNDRNEIEEKSKEAFTNGSSFFEGNLLSKNGNTTPYFFTELRATIEAAPCIIGMGINISERKEMERIFEETREYAEVIVEAVRESLIVLDANSKIITANRSFYGTFKVTPEEAKGRSLYELGNRQWDIPRLKMLLEDVMVRHKKFHNFEVTLDFPAVGRRTMLLNGRRIHKKESSSQMILLAIEDITERKKIVEEIWNEKQLVESIINSLPGIFYVFDYKGRMLRWNINFETTSGYSAEEISKMGFSDFLIEGERMDISKRLQGAFLTSRSSFEGNLLSANGRVITYLFTELHANIDNKRCIIGMAVDISARKKMEKDLQEAMRVKSYFTSVVSHELRTPLASIKEAVNVVFDEITGQINEKQKRCLKIAKDNADRLARLINDILDFQKMETGKMVFDMKENDINETAAEVYNTMLPLAKNEGLDFAIHLADALPKVIFDKDKITQVITNLVSNAAKFTDKGAIAITTTQDDNFVKILVEDTGPGINKEDMPKLFQQFEQLERSGGKKNVGTGLGLVICKEIIDRHKGKIWVESEVGKGTKVYFVLPIG